MRRRAKEQYERHAEKRRAAARARYHADIEKAREKQRDRYWRDPYHSRELRRCAADRGGKRVLTRDQMDRKNERERDRRRLISTGSARRVVIPKPEPKRAPTHIRDAWRASHPNSVIRRKYPTPESLQAGAERGDFDSSR